MTNALLVIVLWANVMTATTVHLKHPRHPELGVYLATDPQVQSFVAQSLASSNNQTARDALPVSLVLENLSTRTILSHVLRISFIDSNGKLGNKSIHYFNPRPSVSNGNEIRPHAKRLVSPIAGSLNPAPPPGGSTKHANSEASHLAGIIAHSTSLLVSLDLVVFSDGEMIGPDEEAISSFITGYTNSMREMSAGLLSMFGSGGSANDVVARLQTTLSEAESLRGKAVTGTRDAMELSARVGVARQLLTLAKRPTFAGELSRLDQEVFPVLFRSGNPQ